MVAFAKDYRFSPRSFSANISADRIFRQSTARIGIGGFTSRTITFGNRLFIYDACLSPSLAQSTQEEKLVVGINGAGGVNAGNGATFADHVEDMGGKVFSHMSEGEAYDYIVANHEGKSVEIYGYSRGGNAAVRITNRLGKAGIQVSNLTTFDPHRLMGKQQFILKYDNVTSATNYYQRSVPRTGGALGWWGTNPYWGAPIYSDHIMVYNSVMTGMPTRFPWGGNGSVSHLNIVSEVVE